MLEVLAWWVIAAILAAYLWHRMWRRVATDCRPAVRFDFDSLDWQCHVCKQRRPDAVIAVRSHDHRWPATGIVTSCNVRYCTDKSDCDIGSLFVCWQAKALAGRDGEGA